MTLPDEMVITLLDGTIRLGEINTPEALATLDEKPETVRRPISDKQLFPYKIWGLSHFEATLMDRRLLQLLTVTHEMLQRETWLRDYRHEIGIFTSCGPSDYLPTILPEMAAGRPQDLAEAFTLNDPTTYATRLAYYLDITGPAIATNSGCAGGATALHLAMNSLLAGQCNYALVAAGGSGNSVICLLLSTLALSGSRPLLATLLGSGQSSDGHNKVSYAAPGVETMAKAINEALAAAETNAATVNLLIPAGSDTALGAKLEQQVLAQIYGQTETLEVRKFWGNLGPVSALAALLYLAVNYIGKGPVTAAINSFGLGGNNLHLIAAIPKGSGRPPVTDYTFPAGEDCYYHQTAKAPVTTKVPLNRQQAIDQELIRLLDHPLTPEILRATLGELGLDSYISLTLCSRLETILGEKLPRPLFAPDKRLQELRTALLTPPAAPKPPLTDTPSAVYRLATTAIYGELNDFFKKLPYSEREYFPKPLRLADKLLAAPDFSALLERQQLLLIAIYTPQNKLIGCSCYAENSPQLTCYQGRFTLQPTTLQDFHYLLPDWRGNKIILPELGPFLRAQGLGPELAAGRKRSSGLIVYQEIHGLQARLIALAMADSHHEEEAFYQALLANDPQILALMNSFPEKPVWQEKYFYYLKDNKFKNTSISKLLEIPNDPAALTGLSPIIEPQYLFTLTAARMRVKEGWQNYVGLSFHHFEPLFLGNIKF